MQDLIMVPPTLQALVDRELEPRERVRWLDMPTPRFFTRNTLPIFLFAIPWTAFSVFWITMAAWGTFQARDSAPGMFVCFPLFGVPFVLIGLGMLGTPLWGYLRARRTVYFITDRRAVTIEAGRAVKIRAYLPEQLQNVERTEYSDGTGDVILERTIRHGAKGRRYAEEKGFLRIRDPHNVARLLNELAARRNPEAG